MKSKRIPWLDFAKGIVILIVVICHSLMVTGDQKFSFELLENVLLIFAMPLFFAISGFLYKPQYNMKGFKILLYKKISSFLIPYIFLTVIDIMILPPINANHNPLMNLYRIYQYPLLYLWFLYSLFFIFIIVGLMNLFHIKLIIQLIISLGLMVLQMYLPWQESTRGNINPISGICGYMICFYIGYLIKKFNFVHFLENKKYVFTQNVLWLVLVVIELHVTGVAYNTNVFNYGDIITKLLSIPVFFSLFIMLKQSSNIFKYFTKYGKYTLIIYLMHYPIVAILIKILPKLFNSMTIVYSLILIILGWYLSIFVCKLSNRFKLVNFVFYPRKYINKIVLRMKWGRRLLLK